MPVARELLMKSTTSEAVIVLTVAASLITVPLALKAQSQIVKQRAKEAREKVESRNAPQRPPVATNATTRAQQPARPTATTNSAAKVQQATRPSPPNKPPTAQPPPVRR